MTMVEKFYDFDPAEMLDSDEAIEAFLAQAMETSDAKVIASALGVVARAKGMTNIARETGLAGEHLQIPERERQSDARNDARRSEGHWLSSGALTRRRRVKPQGGHAELSRRNDASRSAVQLRTAVIRDTRHAMLKPFLPGAMLIVVATAGTALASSSDWYEAEGGSIRLVTAGAADEQGVIQGAVEIQLKPGWKTYWLDPGDAGVPPTIDVSASRNVASAEMSFPAPRRFDDGLAKWAGYDWPVSFPVAFRLGDAKAPAAIEAKIFLGVCETICVPVDATLKLDVASDPDNADDAAVVRAALAALPGPEQPDFGVTLIDGGKDDVLVEAAFAGEPDRVDFFLAGAEGYQFGPPERRMDGERLLFSVPILDRPATMPAKGALHYTLVTSAGAVSGMLPFPPAQ